MAPGTCSARVRHLHRESATAERSRSLSLRLRLRLAVPLAVSAARIALRRMTVLFFRQAERARKAAEEVTPRSASPASGLGHHRPAASAPHGPEGLFCVVHCKLSAPWLVYALRCRTLPIVLCTLSSSRCLLVGCAASLRAHARTHARTHTPRPTPTHTSRTPRAPCRCTDAVLRAHWAQMCKCAVGRDRRIRRFL